jgi:hypothetical protein
MARRWFPFAAAVLVAASVGLVTADAAAAEPPALWVVSGVPNCSDSGGGTQDQPYCTLTAAAAAVSAGQTVNVSGSFQEHLTIAKSGTPDAPIVFRSPGGDGPFLTGADAGITIAGQHDVTVRDFHVLNTTLDTGILVDHSARITLQNDWVATRGTGKPAISLSAVTDSTLTSVFPSSLAGPGLVLDEATSGVTVTGIYGSLSGPTTGDGVDILGPDNAVVHNRLRGNNGAGIYVGPLAHRTVLAGNQVQANGGLGVDISSASGVAIANNTVVANCAGGIRVRDGATGTSVQNNIVAVNGAESGQAGCSPPLAVGIGIYDTSVASSTVDYNIVRETAATDYAYAWGRPVHTLAEFQALSGQGQHDSDADPQLLADQLSIALGSPAIDSANSAAPGWLSADILGVTPKNDPDLPDSGGGPVLFADRGAQEANLLPRAKLTLVSHPGDAVGGWPVTADASTSAPGWATNLRYQFDFGDGTTVTSSTPVVDHVYQAVGRYVILLTLQDAEGEPSTASLDAAVGDLFQAAGPVRVLDTRSATGVPTTVAVAPKATLRLRVAGVGGTPATGLDAVVLNTTVTAPSAGGFLTVYPDGGARPSTSNLNWTAGATVANLVTVPVTNGVVDFYNGSTGTVHIVADLTGYYANQSGMAFTATRATRVLDTRIGVGAPKAAVPAHATLTLDLSRVDGPYPVALNMTVTGGTAGGYLTVFPHGQTRPLASSLNWTKGQTVANAVIVPASDGSVSIYNGSSGTVQVIADREGEFAPVLNLGGNPFLPAGPKRLLDTRSGAKPVAVPPHDTVALVVDPGTDGVPARGVAGVLLNVTVTGGTAPGYLAVTPYPASSLDSSNLNWAAGQTVANLVFVPVDITDILEFYNGSSGTVNVVVDLFGWYPN